MSNLLKAFHLNDNFFGKYEKLVVEQVIPYQEKALLDEIPGAEKSHAIENFRQAAKMLAEGCCAEEFYGMVFQDSDVAKWIEGVAYLTKEKREYGLEEIAEGLNGFKVERHIVEFIGICPDCVGHESENI